MTATGCERLPAAALTAEEQRLLQPEYQKKLAAVIAGTLSVWLSEEHPNEI